MKKTGEKKYYVRGTNSHLMNILEENYYMDLGVIDMGVLDKIIKFECVDINELIHYELLLGGVGTITSANYEDCDYQLNYLRSLRQKNSSNKTFITVGTITYLDEFKCEKYAPIFLIPVEIDYLEKRIIASQSPFINSALIRYLSKLMADKTEDQNSIIDVYLSKNYASSGQMDKTILDLAQATSLKCLPQSYLTVFDVEYQDFAMDDEYFTQERSIYSTTDMEIIRDYYKNVYGVLSTNITQKYVILKASRGDSFVVNGTLGTGKTYTIVNILADAIRKGKKVLYLNQDLDNIWDVERTLWSLNLNKYTHNLTRSLENYNTRKKELPALKNVTFEEEDFAFLEKFDNTLNKDVHGFTIKYIMEKYATLKNMHMNIELVDLESQLYKYEIDELYAQLKQVEQDILKVGCFEKNNWKKLSISHNNVTPKEIVERVNILYDIHLKLNKELNSFCKKYQFALPKDITDLTRLISYILHFKTATPLPSWKSEDVRKQAAEALEEIKDLSDINYNATKYYEENINKNYKLARALEIYQEICASHLMKFTNEEIIKYLDNILSHDAKIQQVINLIEANHESYINAQKRLDKVFEQKDLHKKITPRIYEFFVNINQFLKDNEVLSSWSNLIIKDFPLFLKKAELVTKLHKECLRIKEEIEKYLVNATSFTFDVLSSIKNSRFYSLSIKKIFDRKKMREDHMTYSYLVEKTDEYYDIMKQIDLIINKENVKKPLEQMSKWYINLYDSLKNIDENLMNLIFPVLIKHAQNTKLNLKEIKDCLNFFIESSDKINKTCAMVSKFGVLIDGTYGFEKVDKIYSFKKYFEKVAELKKELAQVFIKHPKLSAKILFELLEHDHALIDANLKIEKNKNRYIELLGDNYLGYDTNITEVSMNVHKFSDFVARLTAEEDINDLLEEPRVSRLYEHACTLNDLLNKWMNAYRSFSLCFKGSLSYVLNAKISDSLVKVSQFIQTTEHIKPILHIIEVIKKCRKHGLNSLAHKIENAEPNEILADAILYSAVVKLYEKVKISDPIILECDTYIQTLNKLLDAEQDYCTKNISTLQLQDDKRRKQKLNNVMFTDYNKIVEHYSRYVNIYLADINIINSGLKTDHFDLVIIDDGHLSSANKYNIIDTCHQCIVFGDKLFKKSYVNTLMQRIGDSHTVNFRNRYIKMSPRFNNVWSINNNYIYNSDTKVSKHMVNSITHFANMIVEFFSKNESHIINVVVGSEATKRDVYVALVKGLEQLYPTSMVIDILCYNIRLIDANEEGSRYVNDVMIYYNDFLKFEKSKKELIFKNFIVVSSSVHIYYLGTNIYDSNTEILKNINETIGKALPSTKRIDGISELLFNRLKAENITCKVGFGLFDIIIDAKKMIGIVFVGKNSYNNYSFMDDYHYYMSAYSKEFSNSKNDWIVKTLYVGDLIENFEKAIKEIKNLL